METTVKKREWVKDAAIIFLAVLLVLTFFSNTIMNRSLPEVATAQVSNGSIVAKVRGSGTVAANGRHQVKAKETRTIRAVMIRAGQEVNAGDVLFVLGEGDETELEQARETLRELQYAYQRTAVTAPTFNYSSYYRSIKSAENEHEKALAKFNKALDEANRVDMDPVTTAAKNRYEDARDRAEEIENTYAAEAEAKKAQLQSEIDDLAAQLPAAQAQADADPSVAAALADCETAAAEYEAALNAAAAAQESMELAREHYEMLAQSSDAEGAAFEEYSAALTDYEQKRNDYNSKAAAAESAADSVSAAEANLESARANASGLVNSLYAQIEAKEAELASWQDEAHYEEVRAAIELRDRLYDEYKRLAGTVVQDLENAADAVNDAALAVEAAYEDLYAAQEMNASSLAATDIDLQQQAEKIKLQQEKIKSLAGEEENVITADVSGVVESIDCTAGDTVLKDKGLCTIEVQDMGHTLSFSVTNDQAQRLRIGDTATVSNYYWGNSVTATLSSIRTDPKNPQGGKVLTFDLTGDVTTGSELTISVGQKSANYDLIVPNAAIKNDTNGSYVFVVTAKNSPLGNRYAARRVSVEILAGDDNNSAVLADLYNGDYVITTSSSPLKNGDLVRLADS